ncbi:MAG: hypothetical protein LWX83_19305, partial [Anaerolineae bacterium]|nr:hypothetical protein [Anaerolineae bacterium]
FVVFNYSFKDELGRINNAKDNNCKKPNRPAAEKFHQGKIIIINGLFVASSNDFFESVGLFSKSTCSL